MSIWSWIKNLFRRTMAPQPSIPRRPVPATEQPPTIPHQQRKLINIGLDFGTSASKVAFRDLLEETTYLLPLRPNRTGYDRLILPSTVALANGRLFFGNEPAELDGGPMRFLRSFKVCVACQTRKGECRGCEREFSGQDSLRGHFLLDGQTVPASDIATLYLAYLMKLAKNLARQRYQDGSLVDLTFNTAVPIDHLERTDTREVFEKLAFTACHLSDAIYQGIPFDEALHLCRQTEKTHPTVPDDSTRRSFVLAEPLAAVISYLNSPHAEQGFHAIVDIGAGTTDVSFFKRFTGALDSKIAFFHCDNHLVGGDNVDHAILQVIQRAEPEIIPREELRSAVQAAKERYANGPLTLGVLGRSVTLDGTQMIAALAPLRKRLFDGYCQTWRTAYTKERRESSWQQYTVFLVGGGTRFRQFRDVVLQKPWDRIRQIQQQELLQPSDFRCLNTEDATILQQNYAMFAVAYGVSRHYAEWPEFFRPMDTETWEVPIRSHIVPTWDDFLNQD